MSDFIFCQGCGKEIHRTATACPHCGFSKQPKRALKNRTGAGVLALLVGGLGFHRFYLGQWWGLLYLVFFCTGLPMLIAIVEGIVFLCSDQENWDAKYNNGVSSVGSPTALVAILAVVGFFFAFFVTGILAAIALPAYQDYTMRAKVMEAVSYARHASLQVGDFVERTRSLPDSLTEAGFEEPLPRVIQDIALDEQGNIEVTLRGSRLIDDKSFRLHASREGTHISWQCEPLSLPDRYLPRDCRSGD